MLRYASLALALLSASSCADDTSPAEAKRAASMVDAFFALCPFADNGGAFADAARRAQAADDMKIDPGSTLSDSSGHYEAKWRGETIDITYSDTARAVRCALRFKRGPDLTQQISARLHRDPLRDSGGAGWNIGALSYIEYRPFLPMPPSMAEPSEPRDTITATRARPRSMP